MPTLHVYALCVPKEKQAVWAECGWMPWKPPLVKGYVGQINVQRCRAHLGIREIQTQYSIRYY